MKKTVISATSIAVFCCVVMLSSVAWSANDMKNGTLIDYHGLVWLKDANCFGKLNWADAKSRVASLASGQCGLTDGSKAGQWRLPTMLELKSVFSSRGQFSNVTYPYWSSTPYSTDAFSGSSWYYIVIDEHTVTYNNSVGVSHLWPVRNQ